MKNFLELEEKIEVSFQNKDLLRHALTHRSYLNENSNFELGNNERLEFLGDAVLEIVVTEFLYFNFPDRQEGILTSYRASLVNTIMLASITKEIGADKYLFLSKGEAKDNSEKARSSILANTMEAIIGAIYLDQGMEVAKKFITKNIIGKIDYILQEELYLDPKSKFQEIVQDKYGITPHYNVLSEDGPDHQKIFEVGLYLKKELIAKGKGKSKQAAQVDAAKNGLKLKKINKNVD